MKNSISKNKGFTISELMIATTIAIILLLGVMQIFVSTKKSTRTNDSFARLQENLRFATEMITREVRMGGYTGCRAGSMNNVLNDITNWNNDTENPVRGYDGDSGTSGFPSDLTNAVSGSDALVVLRGDNTDYRIVSHNPNSANFKIAPPNDLVQGEILIVTDCTNSAVFQVTSSNSSNQTIGHNTGTINLSDGSTGNGNCYKKLGPIPDPTPSCGGGGGSAYSFQGDGKIMRMVATAYYIAPSSSGQTRSLYQVQVREGIVNVPEELVEGIESMQVLFGEDTNGNGLPNTYKTATEMDAGANDFKNVVSVRVGMLVQSVNEVKPTDDTSTYQNVADLDIGPPAGSTTVKHSGGKKMRFVINTTIKVRNSGLM